MGRNPKRVIRHASPVTQHRIHVAVGILRDPLGRVLIGRRAHPDRYFGQWEFPGGKIEPGEDVVSALRRELREELEIELESARPLIAISHDYPDRRVRLEVYEADWRGQPRAHVHQELRFVPPEELLKFDMLEGNRPISAAVRLPDYYLITDPRFSENQILAKLENWCRNQRVFVQVRDRQKGEAELIAFTRAVRARVSPAGRVLINRRFDLVEATGVDGVHLGADQLRTLAARPLPQALWVGASCHDAAELARAREMGVDFAVLSPVQATVSHPAAEPLGWDRFTGLCADANLPVYALGGVGAHDLDHARSCGGRGVAMVSAAWEQPQP
jgi:8-oxo-dGTP diphosphatase